MATVYVVYAEEDTLFVKQQLLRSLPSNGYFWWQSSSHFEGTAFNELAVTQALDHCQAVLLVLSPAILASPAQLDEVRFVLDRRPPLIVVQRVALSEQAAARLPPRLWAFPRIDLAMEGDAEADRLLVDLLPPSEDQATTTVPAYGERIEWNEAIFTAALVRATTGHAHARVKSLVQALVGHLVHRSTAYPPQDAFRDLQALRQEREFSLMHRYGATVIASGTRQDRVRRLFCQALIETAHYDQALAVLQSIVDDPNTSQGEIFEARGLIGRTFKQRYVNAPAAAGAAELLWQAIRAYETAYVADAHNFWHGVNATSCMLRAARDGIAAAQPDRAHKIAQQIVYDLEKLAQKHSLKVWDCASQVEALLALGEYNEAEAALDRYIHHPDMTAFEVSSTFRQFDQVLELSNNPHGIPILARLRSAMEHFRAGKFTQEVPPLAGHAMTPVMEGIGPKHYIIRLSDSSWEPSGLTDLVIQSRLGKIVTASGSEASIYELLTDLRVVSIEESRPAGRNECDRSMPFIKVAQQYPQATGTYEETGGSALIAVIDNGIDVLHETFLNEQGQSRIVGIWDQNASGGTPPQGATYGVFHDEATIVGYVQTGTVPLSLGRNEHGHGTHVASIAGGRALGGFAGGVAPAAKLLIVIPASNESIGYAQSYIDALVFIDAFATTRGWPVVVNVSQGMNAGAHDGKSKLEVAFDGFSESGRKPGRVVVKSAGNERGKGGHAKVSLNRDSLERLSWRRAPGADYAEHLELWWSSADEIDFRLGEAIPPSTAQPNLALPATWSDWVGTAAPERQGVFPQGGPYRLAFTKRHVDNGDSLLQIELGNATGIAGLGDWLLEIRSGNIWETGEVHCWIERNQGVPTAFLTHGDEEMTLSIPGTAQSVITVGAVDACRPLQVGAFSSYGPTRDGQWKPLVCAPGVNVRAAEGGTSNGVFSDSGTSMAAPHVSGAIALLLSRAAKKGRVLCSNQIAAALRQKTQNYNGKWDRGQGYGVLDVSALLAAFD